MARFRSGESRSGFGKVAGGCCGEGIGGFKASRSGGDRNGRGAHLRVGPISVAAALVFILSSPLIFLEGFWSMHVRVIHPFVSTIRIPLPLDQVLASLPPSIVAFVQNCLDLVLFLPLN